MSTTTEPSAYQQHLAAERAKAADLLRLAHDTAHALGTDWRAQRDAEDRGRVYLHGPDGLLVQLAYPPHQGYARVEASGNTPADVRAAGTQLGNTYGYWVHGHTISVRADRGPAVLAREVTRRLLPGYTAEVATLRTRVAGALANANARQALADELAGILTGIPAATDHQGRPATSLTWSPTGTGYARVEVGYDGASVRLEGVVLPAALARRVLAVLAQGEPA